MFINYSLTAAASRVEFSSAAVFSGIQHELYHLYGQLRWPYIYFGYTVRCVVYLLRLDPLT